MVGNYKILAKDIFLDVIWEILYFPVWWYSQGLKKTFSFCWRKIKSGWQALALSIFLANFFKPMYGQRGWDVYFLSFFARFWHILFRLVIMAFWLTFWLAVMVLWLILPFWTIGQLFA